VIQDQNVLFGVVRSKIHLSRVFGSKLEFLYSFGEFQTY